jgi:hypothetical protein
MKYVCSVCKKEAIVNDKLSIHFCKQHGFSIIPIVGKDACLT